MTTNMNNHKDLPNGHASNSDFSYDGFMASTTSDIREAAEEMETKGAELASKATDFVQEQRTKMDRCRLSANKLLIPAA